MTPIQSNSESVKNELNGYYSDSEFNDYNMNVNLNDFDLGDSLVIDADLLDIDNDITISGANLSLIGDNLDSRYIKPRLRKKTSDRSLKYAYAEDLVKGIDVTEGSRYFFIVNGSFIFGDVFESLIVKHNWHVKSMTISTLSLSENNVDSFVNLIDGGYLDELNLIVSDYFFSHERRNLIEYIYEQLDKPTEAMPEGCFQLAVAGTHCKTVIIETHPDEINTKGLKIVCHGSANLRSSGNIEQLQIEENEELYDFNYEYQKNIIEKYKTIEKSVRSKTLWESVTKEKNG